MRRCRSSWIRWKGNRSSCILHSCLLAHSSCRVVETVQVRRSSRLSHYWTTTRNTRRSRSDWKTPNVRSSSQSGNARSNHSVKSWLASHWAFTFPAMGSRTTQRQSANSTINTKTKETSYSSRPRRVIVSWWVGTSWRIWSFRQSASSSSCSLPLATRSLSATSSESLV